VLFSAIKACYNSAAYIIFPRGPEFRTCQTEFDVSGVFDDYCSFCLINIHYLLTIVTTPFKTPAFSPFYIGIRVLKYNPYTPKRKRYLQAMHQIHNK
jgi:hypothetical protein